jgi:hypothetical protein
VDLLSHLLVEKEVQLYLYAGSRHSFVCPLTPTFALFNKISSANIKILLDFSHVFTLYISQATSPTQNHVDSTDHNPISATAAAAKAKGRPES